MMKKMLGSFPLCLILAVSSAFGEQPEAKVDRTKSRMCHVDNGTIRLGVDLNIGGAVTWLSKSGSNRNLINSYDWGRQIQMSFYSGPAPFTPNGKQPRKMWEGLGWNPIQAGDSFAHGSKVIEHRVEGSTLYVKCIPMHWPLDNQPGECAFESLFTLAGNVVKCSYTLNNARSDTKHYEAHLKQELPAIYANSEFFRTFTYTGDKPFTGEPMDEIVHIWNGSVENVPDTGPWAHWISTERWVAMVDTNNFGLGIWTPETTSFDGGNVGTVIGKGGPTDPETNYVGPAREDIIDHNIKYEYACRFIVGELDGIRKYVYEKTPRIVSPDYQFNGTRNGWIYRNAVDTGWPIKGRLDIRFNGGDSLIQGPPDFWRADAAQKIYIRATLKSDTASCRLSWQSIGETDFNDNKSVPVKLIGDGKPRLYEIDLSGQVTYKGGIARMALNINSATAGDSLKIDSISFRK